MTDTTDTIDCTEPATRAELVDIVVETLDGLAESSLSGTPLPDVDGHEGLTVQAELRIVGGVVDARFVLRVPASAAVALTSAMTEEDADELTLEDACGTVAELCNVIGGMVKTIFAEETALRVPKSAVVAEADLEPLDVVDVAHPLGRFQVHVGA